MPTRTGLTTYSDLLREGKKVQRAWERLKKAQARYTALAEKQGRDAAAVGAREMERWVKKGWLKE